MFFFFFCFLVALVRVCATTSGSNGFLLERGWRCSSLSVAWVLLVHDLLVLILLLLLLLVAAAAILATLRTTIRAPAHAVGHAQHHSAKTHDKERANRSAKGGARTILRRELVLLHRRRHRRRNDGGGGGGGGLAGRCVHVGAFGVQRYRSRSGDVRVRVQRRGRGRFVLHCGLTDIIFVHSDLSVVLWIFLFLFFCLFLGDRCHDRTMTWHTAAGDQDAS